MRVMPARDRVCSVYWHWRQTPNVQEYNLAVATTVECAISKVRREVLTEYAGTPSDMVIDAVVARGLNRLVRDQKRVVPTDRRTHRRTGPYLACDCGWCSSDSAPVCIKSSRMSFTTGSSE